MSRENLIQKFYIHERFTNHSRGGEDLNIGLEIDSMFDQGYYNDHAYANGSYHNFRGIFVKQKDVCERYRQLEHNGVNNLTLRLCLAQHAFGRLFEQALEVRQKTRPEDYEFGLFVSGASTSGVATMHGMPKKESGNPGEVVDIGLHNVHQYFYMFCTFSVGVLDRLAVEIRECYGLTEIPEHRIDWGCFFPKDKPVAWKKLNKSIDAIFEDLENGFYQLRDKRNILEHRTFFEIKPGEGGNNFDYFIERNIPLIDFTEKQFRKLLALCNNVYEAIYRDTSEA